MPTYPTVDESRDRLHRAGWSIGEIATAMRWLATGSNGDVDQPYCLLRQLWLGLRHRDIPKLRRPARVLLSVGPVGVAMGRGDGRCG
jgi:hypothetical protein